MSKKPLKLALDKVIPNQNWQLRNKLNEENVERLRQKMQEGVELPPILVYPAGERYEIVDGFHRYEAAKRIGRKTLSAELFEGEEYYALVEGVTRNMTHGFQLMKAELKTAARRLHRPNIVSGNGTRATIPGSHGWIAKKLGVPKHTVIRWINDNERERHLKASRRLHAAKRLVEEVGEEGLREVVLERFGADVLNQTYVPAVSWSLNNAPPGSPGTPMLFWSDWHYGEVVDPEQVLGSNKYNREIAVKRWKHTLTKSVELLKVHLAAPQYPGIVLVLGGDMISGSLHEDSAVTDEVPPLIQAHEAARHIADGVKFLSEQFAHVDVYGVPGNHGRTTRKPWAKFYAHQNLDWLVYQMVKDYCALLPNVTFNVPPVRDLTFTVANRRFRLTHGDQFRGGDGVIGALGPAIRGDMKKRVTASLMPGQPEQYDTLMMGHWHQFSYMPRLIVNGSGKGYDEFALQINAPWEPPQQALFTVHPKHGITWIMPVLADEEYTAHAIERKAA